MKSGVFFIIFELSFQELHISIKSQFVLGILLFKTKSFNDLLKALS